MDLIKKVKELKKNKELMSEVNRKLSSFSSLPSNQHFSELCFCMLTANASAESGIKCQKSIGSGFRTLTEKELAQELKKLKYRFPNKRAHYISLAQEKYNVLSEIKNMKSFEARKHLITNFKGIGMKEASHFLRNIGRKDVAIIDRHILRSLENSKIIKPVKTLNQKEYLKIEDELKKLAHDTLTNLAELDLILWFMQTGKVLK